MERIFKDRPDNYTKIFGHYNYTQNQIKAIKNNSNVIGKRSLHETSDKKLLYYTGGSVYNSYDNFNKPKLNTGFTQIGIEY